MENNSLDEDGFPQLSSSPVIRGNRLRKKSANKKSSKANVCPEDNEVTSTTPDLDTNEQKQHSPVKVDSRNSSDKGNVPSPTGSCEDIFMEEKKEEIADKRKALGTNNIKEKIVICVDTFDDPEGSPFVCANGKKYRTLTMIQRVLTLFLKHKHTINSEHEFALIELDGDSARWRSDFTNDIEDIVTSIENITPNEDENASFDLSTLFELIVENVFPFNASEIFSTSLPPFVVRVIVIYSRSRCMPEFNTGTSAFNLWSTFTSHCFLDTLYIHEKADIENERKAIHDKLCTIETDSSFSFQVVRSAVDIHNCMAKLLAHPLQRGVSNKTAYKVEPVRLGRNASP